MTKSNESNQKQLQSQKALDQQMMEQNISTTIQQIMNDAPDPKTALDEVKSFLTNRTPMTPHGDLISKAGFADELNTANSYKPPQDIIDDINEDMQVVNEVSGNVARNQADVDADNAAVASCQAQIDTDKDKIRDYENAKWQCFFLG